MCIRDSAVGQLALLGVIRRAYGTPAVRKVFGKQTKVEQRPVSEIAIALPPQVWGHFVTGTLQDVADVFQPLTGIIPKSVQILAMDEVRQQIRNVADSFFIPKIELFHCAVGKLMEDRTHRMAGGNGGPNILNHASPLCKVDGPTRPGFDAN